MYPEMAAGTQKADSALRYERGADRAREGWAGVGVDPAPEEKEQDDDGTRLERRQGSGR